jgi:hypothetical protein
VVDVGNIKRGMAVTRTNHCYFYYSPFYDREFILVICRKSVLIDTFVLDEIVRIVAEVVISP